MVTDALPDSGERKVARFQQAFGDLHAQRLQITKGRQTGRLLEMPV